MDCKVEEEKQLTLDEAIAHAEERVNDTPCGRQHKQLADWLKELREMKHSPNGNAAAIRDSVVRMRDMGVDYNNDGDYDSCFNSYELVEIANAALSKPARNCDLFGGDKDKLHAKWWEWSGTKEGQNEDGTVKLTFGEWLLEESDKECSTATIPDIELVKSDNEHLRKAINHIVYYVGERVANRMTDTDFTVAVQNEVASAKGKISCQLPSYKEA